MACVQSNPGNVWIFTLFLQLLLLIDIQFPECHLFGGKGLGLATPKKQPKEKAYPQAMSPTSPVLLKPATPVAVMASTTPILTVPVLPQLPFYPQNGGWGKFSCFEPDWMNECSSFLGGCSDCGGPFRIRNARCSRCAFSLCESCEEQGRTWHHVAVMGIDHTFNVQ